MGNCLSTCAKSPDPPPQDCIELKDAAQGNLSTDTQALGGEKVRELVQQELQALQDQISHSQAVLAKLHFRFTDESVSLSGTQSELAKVHRTTQTSNPDTLPKSLECVPTTAGEDRGWQQITSSCPAIVNTAVQTDDETTSKSNGTSGEYFLPPISPLDSQASEPASPKDLNEISSKPFEPRPLGHIDLDIYRSCRKLSVLPEEETMVEETSPPTAGSRLAPSHYPHHQAHSFESYLLPMPCGASVRRQLSDPTPSPEIHPASRRSSRSTCRPLQLQPDTNYFRFPEVKPPSEASPTTKEAQAPKSPPCVKFQDQTDFSEEDYFPRITSPTYNILQDTVSQLITMSTESLDAQTDHVNVVKKDSLTIPGYYTFTPDGSTPFKTPPDNSLISTPGFFTPQEFFDKKLPESSTSSSFQTPSSASPGANGITAGSNKSTSNSSYSYKTPPLELMSDEISHPSSFSSPLYMSPLARKRTQPSNESNEHAFTEVPDLKNIRTNSKLYVKPLSVEFDRNRTMLSILLDEPRVQNDNISGEPVDESTMPFISFTSLDIQRPPAPPDQVPSTSLNSPDASLSPGPEGLARTPSRRRLQRSLVRISSETPLELVPVEASVTVPPADLPAANNDIPVTEDQSNGAEKVTKTEDGPKMRRTNSDGGSGLLTSVGSGAVAPTGPMLTASHSFPSLSDTVLRQLGALMEEVKQQKEENQSSEKDIENKFTSLMLAFKTDKLTLDQRLELQRRLRDQAESNMAGELNKLKAAVQLLSPLCTDSEKIELLEKVSEQVDALHKSTTRVSTSAEMYGAVQQENRLSKAVDIILRHVENLKQAYDKEKTDHEETRKIITDNKSPSNAVLKLEGRGLSRVRLGSLPRRLSNTILEADPEDSTTKDLINNTAGASQPRELVENISSIMQAQTRGPVRAPLKPTTSQERRVSHTGETESEDETSALEPSADLDTPVTSADTSSTYTDQRRVSLQVVLLSKLSEHMEWAGPADQLMIHARYGVAAVLLVAALAVFASTFILPHTHLGS
ncbi:mucin-5AC-like isoform X2 [Homalodisca vitripennis]|uniref:mucin-5AC-like isoform X2 n=1 Tax=Homalodisca vitripennis TaxID=197043 RepID=UPI001EEB1115|nr:mucin-5AC-like isoform X2 [Homalodisca vitripennis]